MRATPLILAASLALALNAQAQTAAAAATTSGTLIIVPAFGEVKHANDEATVTFSVEEQDKDRAAAQARVNQKMKQGTDIVRREDPQAQLKTVNYYSYPVYPEVPDNPPRPMANAAVRRIPIGWRVGQYLEVKTRSLDNLPKTAAAAQKVLAISNIDYHLSPELTRKLDDERIAATYRNLNERIVSIAHAMGRNVSDAVIDTVDFEGSGHYAGGQGEAAPRRWP
jgi:predicted secreted protein